MAHGQSEGIGLAGCRDVVPYQKVYSALSVIELEFDRTLTNFAYQAVLKVCAKDCSEPAARMALRILDGLRVRDPLHDKRCLHNDDLTELVTLYQALRCLPASPCFLIGRPNTPIARRRASSLRWDATY